MDKRLMIGDWVRVATKAGKKDVQVNNIDADGWIIYDGGVSYDYEPIVINEDYLIDVGFSEHQLIGDTERLILKDEAGNRIITMDYCGNYYNCTFKVKCNVGSIRIEFVHQFQHLCCLLGVALMPTKL